MSTTPLRPARRQEVGAPAPAPTRRRTPPVPVLAIAAAAALLRLPYAGAPMFPDEGGFLVVAGRWGHGSSLYGPYWVDRPPLLIALYRLADLLGPLFGTGPTGALVALRLLGCVAAAVTVVAVGLAVRRAAGPRASTWAAATAAGLLVSPLLGSVGVNGELLAAPFVATGAWLAIAAVLDTHRRAAVRDAALAGVAAAAAVLVKQNMLDVVVLMLVLLVVAWRTGHLDLDGTARRGLAFLGGGVLAGGLVLGGAALAGTGPGAVLFAMYQFRLRAAGVMQLGSVDRLARLDRLGLAAVASGCVLVVLALVPLAWRRRARARESAGFAVTVATIAVAAYDVVSVAGGGSYWTHYLVQLAVPTALAAGLVTAARPGLGRVLVALVLASSAMAWTVGQGLRVEASGPAIGRAVAQVSRPGDTVISLMGDPSVVQSSGLQSPYPYLWSLPARTLDPGLHGLGAVLAGDRAPSWIVDRGSRTTGVLARPGLAAVVRQRYHQVTHTCGRTILLRDGLQRAVPRPTGCRRTFAGWLWSTPSAGATR